MATILECPAVTAEKTSNVDYSTYAERNHRRGLMQSMEQMAKETERDGDFRTVTTLAFFCAECGEKLNVTQAQDVGSVGNSFNGLEENRLILMVEPCRHCSEPSFDYLTDYDPVDDADDDFETESVDFEA